MANKSVTIEEIKDFTPGIADVVSPNHPPGQAQPTNTYRCYSLPGGALAPLPKTAKTISHVDPTVATRLSEEVRIIGIHCNSPVFYASEASTGIYQDNTEIYVCLEWYENDGKVHYAVDRYKNNYSITPAWDQLWTDGYTLTYSASAKPHNANFITQRTNSQYTRNVLETLTGVGDSYDGGLIAGPVVVAWTVDGYAQFFPDDTSTNTNSVARMPGDRADPDNPSGLCSPDALVGHQLRGVIFPLTLSNMGANQIVPTNESMLWTATNNLTKLGSYYYDINSANPSANYFNILGGSDKPSRYECMESLTADELLLIKSYGGAIMIRGSLNDPTVVNLPYVHSAGFSMNRGCISPKGFLYPVDGGGLWLWEGGDVSTPITPQMKSDFWRPPPYAPAGTTTENGWGYAGTTCALWDEWILLPNNYLWDSATNGLWRIDNVTDFIIHRWAVDWRGLYAYGAPTGFQDENDVAIYGFNKLTPSDSFSWQSHPMPFSIEQDVNVREVTLVASGDGTVIVSITTGEDTVGQTATFNVTSTTDPFVRKADLNVHGSHVVMRIESTGADTNTAAPTVHSVRLGHTTHAGYSKQDVS